MVQPMQSAPHPAPLPLRGQWLIHAQLFQCFAGGLLQHGNALFVLLYLLHQEMLENNRSRGRKKLRVPRRLQ